MIVSPPVIPMGVNSRAESPSPVVSAVSLVFVTVIPPVMRPVRALAVPPGDSSSVTVTDAGPYYPAMTNLRRYVDFFVIIFIVILYNIFIVIIYYINLL